MADYLLDTCAVLHLAQGSPQFAAQVGHIILDPDNTLYISVAASWEIIVKNIKGKLPLPLPPDQFIQKVRREQGLLPLRLLEEDVLRLVRLPPPDQTHGDPFDRMMVCQVLDRAMPIITCDTLIPKFYGHLVQVISYNP